MTTAQANRRVSKIQAEILRALAYPLARHFVHVGEQAKVLREVE